MAIRTAAGRRVLQHLERLREERDVSRAELAKKLGHSSTWLTLIVQGKSNITLADASTLAEALGVRLEVVAPGNPAQQLRAALDADGEITPEWREAVWAVYKAAKSEAVGRGAKAKPVPGRSTT